MRGPFLRPAAVCTALLAGLFVFTTFAARWWHDAVWGIPNPWPPLAALAATVLVVGWWGGARVAERRLAAAAAAGGVTLAVSGAWFSYLATLAAAPCESCSESFPTCCEAWGLLFAAGPVASVLAAAIAALVAGVSRARQRRQGSAG